MGHIAPRMNRLKCGHASPHPEKLATQNLRITWRPELALRKTSSNASFNPEPSATVRLFRRGSWRFPNNPANAVAVGSVNECLQQQAGSGTYNSSQENGNLLCRVAEKVPFWGIPEFSKMILDLLGEYITIKSNLNNQT